MEEKCGSDPHSTSVVEVKDMERLSATSIESCPSPPGSIQTKNQQSTNNIPEPHMGLLSSCNMVNHYYFDF